MRKLTRLVAVGAALALPLSAAATSATAQTPGQYQPYAPAQPAPQIVATYATAGLSGKIGRNSVNKLGGNGSTSVSVRITGPGTYELRITGKVPGQKKTVTLASGKVVIAAGSTAQTATIKLKSTKYGKSARKNRKKIKGKTLAVNAVVTFTPPAGKAVSLTKKAKLKK